MSDAPVSLEAKSPFELRVQLGDAVTEQSVREALASGDMGFLHSYTTGSTVDGPGVLDVTVWKQKNSMTVHMVNLTNPMMMRPSFREMIPCTPQQVRLSLT